MKTENHFVWYVSKLTLHQNLARSGSNAYPARSGPTSRVQKTLHFTLASTVSLTQITLPI